MGASYSIPPRGFLYSKEVDGNPQKRKYPVDMEERVDFGTFREMFLFRFEDIKDLGYITEYDSNGESYCIHTYGDTLQKMRSFFSALVKETKKSNFTAALYCKTSYMAHLAYDSFLFFGIKVFVSSPAVQSFEEFLNDAKIIHPDVLVADKEKAPELRQIFNRSKVVDTSSNMQDMVREKITETDREYSILIDSISLPSKQSKFLSHEKNVKFLGMWSHLLKIGQDTPCLNLLHYGTNLERLMHMIVIYNRTPVIFSSCETAIHHFCPTHVFMPSSYAQNILDGLDNMVSNHDLLKKTYYKCFYNWKKFYLTWGSTSKLADWAIFNNVKPDFGPDLRCIVTEPIADPDSHDSLIVTTGAAVTPLHLFDGWGNIGFGLPAEIVHCKSGTVGCPVGPPITYLSKSRALSIDGDINSLFKPGFWDEEGSFVFEEHN